MEKSTGLAHYGFKREGGGTYEIEELDEAIKLETMADLNPGKDCRFRRGADADTEAFLCPIFKSNIAGLSTLRSQYGKPYVTFSVSCDPQFEEGMGTEKAKQQLRQVAFDAWKPFRDYVAVWRIWPLIERRDDGHLKIYARFHLMTEEALRLFVPVDGA